MNTRTLFVLLTLNLSGCAASSSVSVNSAGLAMPPVPGDIRHCIATTVPEPAAIKTKADVTRVIGELRASEVAKTKCGRRLIALYDKHRGLFGGGS